MEGTNLSVPVPGTSPTITGGGHLRMGTIPVAPRPLGETNMARVVIVRDLADKLGRDKSSFTRLLRRSDIEILKVRDPKTDQMVLAVSVDDVEDIKALITPAHEIVDPSEVI